MTLPTVDLRDIDPVHEAAYTRIRRVVGENQKFVNALVSASAKDVAENWKLKLVLKNPSIVQLRRLWAQDRNFQGYLSDKLKDCYGEAYAKKLISIFLG